VIEMPPCQATSSSMPAAELGRRRGVVVHDAQFRAAEFPAVGHLDHASAEYALAFDREAGVGTVVLFHHASTRTDDELDCLRDEHRA
jgi:ribonuclease BN (tRNA processing enzyme)